MNNLVLGYKDLVKKFFAEKPRDVDGVANQSAIYYQSFLLRKVFSRFEFTGVPEGWDIDYMFEQLFMQGYFAIIDTELGVLPLKCGYCGINVFNKPNKVIIANHILGSLEGYISVDCALVKLQYNYQGINDMLQRYATLLAMCDSSLSVNLINAKVAFIGFAENKNEAETMKKMYDKISLGEPAVFMRGGDSGLNKDKWMFNRVKENFVGEEINRLKAAIIDDFLTEIGVRSANTEKRERLITSEVNSIEEELNSNVEHWIENVNEGLDTANKLFNLELGFRKRILTEKREGGANDEFTESSRLVPT